MHFAKTPFVDGSGVSITLTNDESTYLVAAARTFTDVDQPIEITFGFPTTTTLANKPTAVIQPFNKSFPCNIVLENADDFSTTLEIFDISKYTAVFSNNVLQAEYPLRQVPHHVNYVLFVLLLCGNIFILAKALLVWLNMTSKPNSDIDPKSSSTFSIYKTMFGTSVAFNNQTKQHWNAYKLRKKIVSSRLGQTTSGVPAELENYLFESHFKTE